MVLAFCTPQHLGTRWQGHLLNWEKSENKKEKGRELAGKGEKKREKKLREEGRKGEGEEVWGTIFGFSSLDLKA